MTKALRGFSFGQCTSAAGTSAIAMDVKVHGVTVYNMVPSGSSGGAMINEPLKPTL